MWILRFLNGPLAGQIMPLTKNSTLIGRASGCDIKIPSGSVSKEHTRIEIFDDKIIVSDAGSRNGTFLNGVQVRSSKAKSGDKIAVHDIFFEVQRVPESWAARFQQQQLYGRAAGGMGAPAPNYGSVGHPQAASAPDHDDGPPQEIPMSFAQRLPQMQDQLQGYMDRVVMPGLYRLPEMFEFRWVLAGFMAVFILLVTALSTIPLARILKSSVEEESQQHALTIATTLARMNRVFLTSGQESAVNVDDATARPGVKKAFIISALDGNIIAPAAQAGSYPDLPYVHEGRREKKESVKQIDDSTIIAMVPVAVYNQNNGEYAATHWAVVVYDMRSMAVNDANILSLFITTLFIALILGFALFFFLYKIIEWPIRSLNQQLDGALKEGGETVTVAYMFPPLQLLASNVSSALTRAVSGGGISSANKAVEHDRNREITNLVELMGFAAMGIRGHDLSIAAANPALEQRLNISAATLATQTVNEINDQSLKLSVKDLIARVDAAPDEIASNELSFSGNDYQVVAQAIYGSSRIAYYLIVLLPKEGS